jgi:hypothetical protein
MHKPRLKTYLTTMNIHVIQYSWSRFFSTIQMLIFYQEYVQIGSDFIEQIFNTSAIHSVGISSAIK